MANQLARRRIYLFAASCAVGVLAVTAGMAATAAAATPSGSNATTVSTAVELTQALAHARPGQMISLRDGTYRGNFVISHSGSETAPISIVGSSRARLEAPSAFSGYALHLDGANYVYVAGLTVLGGDKAVVLDQANHDVLDHLDVSHTGEEAILVRNYSSDNVISNTQVHNSGLVHPGYGEGIYIGLSRSNWSSPESRTKGRPDTSDRNEVLANTIYATTAENVDVKEGTANGVVAKNHFDGSGLSGDNYADSWVDLAGNNYLVQGNVGTNPRGSKLVDGYQVHVILSGWGNNNRFFNNRSTVNARGYAINVQETSHGNSISRSNITSGAAMGLTNLPTAP